MIEMLQKILQNKYDYLLEDFAFYEIKREKSKILMVTLIIFGVVTILFIIGLTSIMSAIISVPLYLFLFVLLVIVPFALKKGSKHEAIIVTPRFLIKRSSKSEFTIIDFDEVTKFTLSKEGILIKDRKSSILLGLDLFREEIDPIIDILEAKGKTFDPEKEYMIRPIEIKIVDNLIKIVDIEVKDEERDVLYSKYCDDFEMLTPGFINEIIFTNTNVEKTCITDQNLAMSLDSFEVKGGHPENTTFESITALDCIIVFEKVKLTHLILQDLHNREAVDENLPLNLDSIVEHLENAVISSWKSNGKKMDFHFATGVHTLKVSFTYKEVLIGWNKIK